MYRKCFPCSVQSYLHLGSSLVHLRSLELRLTDVTQLRQTLCNICLLCSFSSGCCGKMPQKNSWGKEKFIAIHSMKARPSEWRNQGSRAVRQLVTLFTVRKQREMNTGAQLTVSFLPSPGLQPTVQGHLWVRWISPNLFIYIPPTAVPRGFLLGDPRACQVSNQC